MCQVFFPYPDFPGAGPGRCLTGGRARPAPPTKQWGALAPSPCPPGRVRALLALLLLNDPAGLLVGEPLARLLVHEVAEVPGQRHVVGLSAERLEIRHARILLSGRDPGQYRRR